MATRGDLRKLARLRLEEAETLYRAELYDGVVYLSGYCIECALKARICKLLGVNKYPDSGNLRRAYAAHDLTQLLLAGLESKIGPGNTELFNNWSVAAKWDPESRNESPGKYSKADALEILEAVRSRRNGVLTWLMKRW